MAWDRGDGKYSIDTKEGVTLIGNHPQPSPTLRRIDTIQSGDGAQDTRAVLLLHDRQLVPDLGLGHHLVAAPLRIRPLGLLSALGPDRRAARRRRRR
ncbi:hypothetical protein VTK73DRAFT_6302 [Phialemonium thermophilum]|uniref:Uncharacterized protein n=1 Tax=Phialemonium thermophilum TaxID=223376 RepID=A0ABR3V0C2_9PEZI